MNKFNNFIAYLLFSFWRIIFSPNGNSHSRKKILFVNLGKIGDAVISSVILTNENIFPKTCDVVLLLQEQTRELFEAYKGKVKILFVDKKKYRLNLIYRYSILKFFRELRFTEVYNFSFSRISIDDEISLIASNGSKVYAFENNPKLNRSFAQKFEANYTELFQRDNGSDLENICSVLEKISGSKVSRQTRVFPATTSVENLPSEYFVVAPYADFSIKEWDEKNYLLLTKKLTEYFGIEAVILHSTRKDVFSKNKFIRNLTGKTTLGEAATIISSALFFVGNDSGLLHIAKAAEVKTFGIVGGGVWGRIFPYYVKDETEYFLKKSDCINCDWVCKFNEARCLTEISVEEVFNKIIGKVRID